ncbi:MAG: D-glycero-beta-D-manno-heptose 1,7-bisphosphate 7-phosphatase [Syntrophaceae bacterium]|nr:D-glycero-beta-D-manno-heptose 1,7-bisphosphate 7-phosphatase [Syntrophaceae bacterium]
MKMHRAVFLDRDGTINEEVGYLSRLDQLQVYPGSAAAIGQLNRAGIKVVVVTNQSGVARGYFEEAFIPEVHALLQEQLGMEGARIDAFYYCPHHPTEGHAPYRRDCSCRKPAAGLLLRASRDLHIDLAQSYMIGDMMKDIQTGKAVGAKCILVRTGYGAGEKTDGTLKPDYIALDLQDAVQWILKDLKT